MDPDESAPSTPVHRSKHRRPTSEKAAAGPEARTRTRVDRRSVLKLVGAAAGAGAISLAAHPARADDTGYGAGGYGDGAYGDEEETDDSDDGNDDTDSDTAPAIETFAVEEDRTRDPHAHIDVAWVVSDDDGDLRSCSVELFADSSGDRVDSSTTAIDGERASGAESFTVKRGAGETYVVVVTATDANGNEASAERTVETDRL